MDCTQFTEKVLYTLWLRYPCKTQKRFLPFTANQSSPWASFAQMYTARKWDARSHIYFIMMSLPYLSKRVLRQVGDGGLRPLRFFDHSNDLDSTNQRLPLQRCFPPNSSTFEVFVTYLMTFWSLALTSLLDGGSSRRSLSFIIGERMMAGEMYEERFVCNNDSRFHLSWVVWRPDQRF